MMLDDDNFKETDLDNINNENEDFSSLDENLLDPSGTQSTDNSVDSTVTARSSKPKFKYTP